MSRSVKWTFFVVLVVAILAFLYWMGGESSLERIEQPVEANQIEAA